MRILLIDNYDSFTYNLYHYLCEVGATVCVRRNDAFRAGEMLEQKAYGDGIVVSPGPGNPKNTGNCAALLQGLPANVPVLGVCLGHQLLFEQAQGTVTHAPQVRHGKSSTVQHDGSSRLFFHVPRSFVVMRYHSLVAKEDTLPPAYDVIARSEDDHLIMAIAHRERPWFGIQFHPESCGTPQGHRILRNFVEMAG